MSLSESATSSKAPEPAWSADRGLATGNRFWRVVLILLAIEAGLFLIVVPWSSAWDENLLVNYFSSWRHIFRSHYVRGALSGLGLVNLGVGIAEAREWCRLHRRPVETGP